MSQYAITFARSARKELESLDAVIVQRVFRKIEALADSPRPQGCRKLTGYKNEWRIRVGDYRVIYSVYEDENRIDIVAVRHRRHAYL
jgi:mRNA interferase RelE/StbE